MEKITSEEITFESSYAVGGSHWSDIMFQGKVIGVLLEREKNLLAPIETTYRVCVPDALVDASINYYESEDEGFVFAWFTELEAFIDFYNKKVLGIIGVRQLEFDFSRGAYG